jgi:hypothetical protein
MPRLTPGYGLAFGGSVARTGTRGSVVYVQMDQQMIADYTAYGQPTKLDASASVLSSSAIM